MLWAKSKVCASNGDVVAQGLKEETEDLKNVKDAASVKGRVWEGALMPFMQCCKGVQGLSKAALTGFCSINVNREGAVEGLERSLCKVTSPQAEGSYQAKHRTGG